MIDESRVREMTHLAVCEAHEGSRYGLASSIYRGDFVARHLIKGFLAATVVFGMLFVMWGVCNMQNLLEQIDTMDYVRFGTEVLQYYVFFLGIYLIAVDIYANVVYASAKKRMKQVYHRLKQLEKLYEQQEGSTAPNVSEDEEGR